MPPAQQNDRRQSAWIRLLPLFLSWYFVGHPLGIIRRYGAYASSLQETFSFVFLLRTLFAPWKRITDPYPANIFNIAKVFETFVFNVITRAVGAVIRGGAIIIGLSLQILLLAGALAFLSLWIAFPFLLAWGGMLLVLFIL